MKLTNLAVVLLMALSAKSSPVNPSSDELGGMFDGFSKQIETQITENRDKAISIATKVKKESAEALSNATVAANTKLTDEKAKLKAQVDKAMANGLGAFEEDKLAAVRSKITDFTAMSPLSEGKPNVRKNLIMITVCKDPRQNWEDHSMTCLRTSVLSSVHFKHRQRLQFPAPRLLLRLQWPDFNPNSTHN
jgi:hypothetical protein